MKPLVLVFAALLALAPLPAAAQAPNLDVSVTVVGHTGPVVGGANDHFMSFSGPFSIPGVSLPAGTYIFKLITPSILQVSSENRTTVYGTFLTLPTWRIQETDDYTVTLRRMTEGAPPRLTAIFMPYTSHGLELMYPKAEAAKAPPTN